MSTFTQRMIGAAKLDVDIYEEVEADGSAMGQAMTVVVLSSLAAGVGSFRRGRIGVAALRCGGRARRGLRGGLKDVLAIAPKLERPGE